MKRRFPFRGAAARAALLAVGALAAVSVWPAAVAAEDRALPVVAADTSRFPLVRLVAAVPPALGGEVLTAANFTLREGKSPRHVEVEALPPDGLEVVLAMDVSGSMSGGPLTAATAAARGLLDRLPATAPVAVVSIGSQAAVVSPRSADRAASAAAIAGLRAGGDTALHDGLITAAAQLASPAPTRRVVIVLSDGADTASKGSIEGAAAALTAARASVFAVHLGAGASRAGPGGDPLSRLTSITGGQLIGAADTAALRPVFDSVAAQLVRQYAVTYRSAGSGATDVTLQVDSGGQRATGHRRLTLPRRPAIVAPASSGDPANKAATGAANKAATGGSPVGAWALAAGATCAALAVFLLLLPLMTREPRPRGGRSLIAGAGRRRFSGLTDRAGAAAEQVLERQGWQSALANGLEQSAIDLRPGEFVVLVSGLAAAGGAIGAMLANAAVGLMVAALVAVGASMVMRFLAARRRRRFADQLAETLQLLSGSLRAGHGLSQAIDTVGRESDSPTAEEFRRVTMEARLGRDLPGALRASVDRVRSKDFHWVVQAIEINREVGGDLPQILQTVGDTIRARTRLRGHVKALSAEGRASALVLFVLPLLLVAVITVTSPTYLDALTGSAAGLAMLAAGALLMAAGGLWLRQIVRPVF